MFEKVKQWWDRRTDQSTNVGAIGPLVVGTIIIDDEEQNMSPEAVATLRQATSEDREMLQVLHQLCLAYAENNRTAIAELEPRATEIGEKLNRRGGLEEMRRIFKMLGGIRGTRTLEMHWGGIGDWWG